MNAKASLLSAVPRSFAEVGLLTLVVTLFLVVNWPLLIDLKIHSFDDGTYSHAYLIPFISIYLLHRAFRRGVLTTRRFSTGIAVLAVLCSLASLILYIAQVALLVRWMLPICFFFSLLIFFRFSLELLLASVVLWFMVPIWGPLVVPLQNLSTYAVGIIMSMTNVPSFIEGNIVTIAVGQFEIAGGCSGLRYFITSCFVAVMFIYLNIRSYKKAVIFTLLCLAGALLTNWIRITVIILIGHFTEMQSPIIQDHNNLGWFIYVPYLALLMWFGRYLVDDKAVEAIASVELKTEPSKFGVLVPSVITFVVILVISPASYELTQSKTAPLDEIQGPAWVFRNIQYNQSWQGFNLDDEYGLLLTFGSPGFESQARSYLNQVPLSSTKIVEQYKLRETSIVKYLSKRNEKRVLMYQFVLGNQAVAAGIDYRISKIEQAFAGERNSQIALIDIPCNLDCDTAIARGFASLIFKS
ncbi:exosortase [Alginatibacterium sediminis]|uniref:exosortase n=1 Tax=Alginatibacterium sediminis TaxID=2164068 RepID=UPI0013148F8C|nr:exosortase [Alginatibacterium sediminis]